MKNKKENAVVLKSKHSIIGFINSEKNIFEIGFFSATDNKKTKNNKYKKITIIRNQANTKIEVNAEIIASAIGRLPSISDQDKWFGLMALVTEEKKRVGIITNPFIFSTNNLLEKIKLNKGGKNYEDVKKWLLRMRETSIRSSGAVYIIDETGEKKRQYGTDAFSTFNRVYMKGDILHDGTVQEENAIEFSEWQLNNINSNKSFLQVDLLEYLKAHNTLAKALIPVLQNWFYPDMVKELGYFEKRYDSFCEFFNVTRYTYLSKIKETLKPSFEELVELKHLRAWDIVKNTNNDGYKVVFYLGEKYINLDKFIKTINIATEKEISERLLLRMKPKEGNQVSHPAVSLSTEQENIVRELTQNFQVEKQKAIELATKNYEESKRQIEAFKYRYDMKLTNKAGWIIEAIKSGYTVPDAYIEAKRKEQSEIDKKNWQTKIDNCSLCDENGWLHITNQNGKSSLQKCNHTQDLINSFISKGLTVQKLYQ
ncbi:MAG: replication initiator protein A [Thaumarchaeota archaeon]|nr:replication initiator protein A [Nitrososphaerota archaeon]